MKFISGKETTRFDSQAVLSTKVDDIMGKVDTLHITVPTITRKIDRIQPVIDRYELKFLDVDQQQLGLRDEFDAHLNEYSRWLAIFTRICSSKLFRFLNWFGHWYTLYYDGPRGMTTLQCIKDWDGQSRRGRPTWRRAIYTHFFCKP